MALLSWTLFENLFLRGEMKDACYNDFGIVQNDDDDISSF